MPTRSLSLSAALEDWKLVYRVLHAHVAEHIDLMDAELFAELQRELQTAAKTDGVDVTDHAAWDAWLGNLDAPTCEERMKSRHPLS